MIIGNKTFYPEKEGYVMGILNVTPDSFSDGGKWNKIDAALKHCEEMIKEGADIIDIGGESTRPGFVPVSEEEEIERVAPVIEAVKDFFDIPVSLDTYKAKVAEAGIEAGADLINDIWGLKQDENIAKVIKNTGVACCLMHNRNNTEYGDFLEDVKRDLEETLKIAREAGISKDKIMLDPGVGFAKSKDQNLIIINHLQEFLHYDVPILLGTSRKSVIGLTLDLPVEERLEGTIATTVLGRMKGAGFFRVHDVKENKRALRMTDAILKAR